MLVENGSEDASWAKCLAWKENDHRINCLQSSKGVSADRNAALKNTITFMLTTAVEHTADVVQCRRKVDNAEGSGNVDVFQGVELTDHHDILDAFLCFQKNYKWTSTRRCK